MEIHKQTAMAAPVATATPLQNTASREISEGKRAAHQFEVMLTAQLVHEITNTNDETSLMGAGLESRMFSSTVEWELAEHISKSARLGIADELLKQISAKESANDHKVSK